MRRILLPVAGIMLIAGATLVSNAALADACQTLQNQNYTYSLTGSSGNASGTISFTTTMAPGFRHNVDVNQNGTTTWYDIQSQPCTDGTNNSAILHLHGLSTGTGGVCIVAPSDYADWTFAPSTSNGYTVTATGWSGQANGGADAQLPPCADAK